MEFPSDISPRHLQSILTYETTGTSSINTKFFLNGKLLGHSSQSVNIGKREVSWSQFAPFATLYPQPIFDDRGQPTGQYHPPPFFSYSKFSGTGLATYMHLICTYELIKRNNIPVDLWDKFIYANPERTANRMRHIEALGISQNNATLREMYIRAKEYLEKKGYDLTKFSDF